MDMTDLYMESCPNYAVDIVSVKLKISKGMMHFNITNLHLIW